MYQQNSVYDASGTPLNNKYNNKELQETGFYDYGWRQYMPDLGRWFGMDQLSEKFHTASPYAYVMNNPAMLIDPDGRDAMFSSGTEEILNQYMVNTYWRQNSSLIPSYSGSALFGFSGINAPTQYSSVSRSWTSSLTPGKQTFDFDYLGTDSNGDIVGDYASIVFTGISSLTRWTMETKVWESKALNNVNWERVNQGLGAFGFGNDVKTQLIDFAVRKNAGLTVREFRALNAVTQEARTIEALGSSGSKYLKAVKGLGTVVTIATTAYSTVNTINYYQNGGNDWKVGVKYGLDLAMTGVGFLGPVGFGISAAYFILDSATDGFNGFGEIPEN